MNEAQKLALRALDQETQAWGIVFNEKLKWSVARGDSPEVAIRYASELADRCMKLSALKNAEWEERRKKIEGG